LGAILQFYYELSYNPITKRPNSLTKRRAMLKIRSERPKWFSQIIRFATVNRLKNTAEAICPGGCYYSFVRLPTQNPSVSASGAVEGSFLRSKIILQSIQRRTPCQKELT
ncbi:MAG: hypothetical protein LIO57_07815, partial [Oscillospiraceae bacterium]|nr:hypothetical protein [Oscillospiraceae bacterium]